MAAESEKGVAAALRRLQAYGSAGVLAYGAMNGIYYSLAFSIAWYSTNGGAVAASAAAASGGGIAAASFKRFLKVFGLVWAGSQVTKAFRAAGALALAPIADNIISKVQRRLGLKSRGAAFGLLASMQLGATLALFALIVLSSALLAKPAVAPVFSSGALGSFVMLPSLVVSRQPVAGTNGRAELLRPQRRCQQQQQRFRHVDKLIATLFGPFEAAAGALADIRDGAAGPAGAKEPRRRRKAAGNEAAAAPPRRNPNIHGWNEHPPYLRGYWVVSEALLAAESSGEDSERPTRATGAEKAAVLLAAAPWQISPRSESRREPTALGEQKQAIPGEFLELEHDLITADNADTTASAAAVDKGAAAAAAAAALPGLGYVVLKGNGAFKVGPPEAGLAPLGPWRFTPANKRLVFQVQQRRQQRRSQQQDEDEAGDDVAVFRYSARVERVPRRYMLAEGKVEASSGINSRRRRRLASVAMAKPQRKKQDSQDSEQETEE